MNSVVHGACVSTNQEVYLPCLAAQGWVHLGQLMLRWQPVCEKVASWLSGSELRVLLLEH